jgi:hypothetical protein
MTPLGVTLSNKSKGDKFRDQIKELCLAAGYAPMTELFVDGKRSDVVYEVFSAPRKRRIAIEAKSLNKPFPKDQTSEVIGDYRRALSIGDIDEVWVVSMSGFTPEARLALTNNRAFGVQRSTNSFAP